MSNIVISGYYGFGNAGDEAMLCAIIDAIRKEEADAHITVISGNPKETSKKHNINAVGTFSAFGILKAIANSDLVISGGGSLLQDATSIRNTYYYLSIMALAKMMGKKVMLYSQGIGPLNRPSTRRAVGFVLRFVDTITVRDSISKAELESLGIDAKPMPSENEGLISCEISGCKLVFDVTSGMLCVSKAVRKKYAKDLVTWNGEDITTSYFQDKTNIYCKKRFFKTGDYQKVVEKFQNLK